MVTIKDIADACGVSVATVSNIINGKGKFSDETKQKVLSYARKMRYKPNAVARNLKMKRTHSIGVIVEDMTIFSIPDIVDGITDYCDQMDYQILLVNLRLFKRFNDSYYNKDFYYEEVRDAIHSLIYKQVDGMIYVTAHERVLNCIPEGVEIPTVMAYGYTNSKQIPSVVVDDVDGGYRVAQGLIEKGHRKIGVITGKSDSLHAQARLLGVQKALYEHAIPFIPERIKTGNWERSSGYELTDSLLKQGVTAIFCMNDLMAGGVYDRLIEKGIKIGSPGGISVIGYDDRQTSEYYRPSLTTVRLPLHDVGYVSSMVMLDLLGEKTGLRGETAKVQPSVRWFSEGGEDKPLVYSVPCDLIPRNSVASLLT